MLKALGYEVVCCSNGEEAVAYYRDNYQSVDAVILDLMMPKLGGLECYRRLREINPVVNVIIASGIGDGSGESRAREEGVKLFLKKPFKVQELSRTVKDAVNRD